MPAPIRSSPTNSSLPSAASVQNTVDADLLISPSAAEEEALSIQFTQPPSSLVGLISEHIFIFILQNMKHNGSSKSACALDPFLELLRCPLESVRILALRIMSHLIPLCLAQSSSSSNIVSLLTNASLTPAQKEQVCYV